MMRAILCLSCLSLLLSGCMVTSFEDQKTDRFIAWNHAKMTGATNTSAPPQVRFYANASPKTVNPKDVAINPKFPAHYKPRGRVYASRYNAWGNKRQTGRIYDVMQNLASEHGANGIIDIKKEKSDYTGVAVYYA